MTHSTRFLLCLCLAGCGTAEVDTRPDDASPGCTTESDDWDGDGIPEVVETFDSDGRIVSSDWFMGTVDAFHRSYTYDPDGRITVVTTETALGRSQQAFPVWEGDLIVAVRRVSTDVDGLVRSEQTPLMEPCGAPYRCLDEC